MFSLWEAFCFAQAKAIKISSEGEEITLFLAPLLSEASGAHWERIFAVSHIITFIRVVDWFEESFHFWYFTEDFLQ